MKLSNTFLKFLIRNLECYDEHLSRAGCNDLTLANYDENWDFVSAAEKWACEHNPDWEPRERPSGDFINTYDFFVNGYLIYILQEYLKTNHLDGDIKKVNYLEDLSGYVVKLKKKIKGYLPEVLSNIEGVFLADEPYSKDLVYIVATDEGIENVKDILGDYCFIEDELVRRPS